MTGRPTLEQQAINDQVAKIVADAKKRQTLPTRQDDYERFARKLSGLLNGPALAAAVRELAQAMDV